MLFLSAIKKLGTTQENITPKHNAQMTSDARMKKLVFDESNEIRSCKMLFPVKG